MTQGEAVTLKARELLAAAIEHYALVNPFDQDRADRVRAGEDSVPLYFPEAIGAIEAALNRPASPGWEAAIEAAAKVADKYAEHDADDVDDQDQWDRGYHVASESIAASIRALLPSAPGHSQ